MLGFRFRGEGLGLIVRGRGLGDRMPGRARFSFRLELRGPSRVEGVGCASVSY